MADMNNTISKRCLMDYDQAALVLDMLEKHDEFSEIGVDIQFDFENLKQYDDSENKLLVIFDIPRAIYFPDFFDEFCKALNSETVILKQKERQ